MTICILLLIVINPTASKQLQESMFVSGKETDASGGSYVKFSKQLEKEKTAPIDWIIGGLFMTILEDT